MMAAAAGTPAWITAVAATSMDAVWVHRWCREQLKQAVSVSLSGWGLGHVWQQMADKERCPQLRSITAPEWCAVRGLLTSFLVRIMNGSMWQWAKLQLNDTSSMNMNACRWGFGI